MGIPRRKRRSLLNTLFTALAFFVVTPVVIMVSTSDFALMSTISEEIAKASIGKLKVAASIDRMMDELVRNTCARIILDPRLATIINVPRYSAVLQNGKAQFDLYLYQNILDDLVGTNEVFHSIHIVLVDTDYVVSTFDGTVPRSEFSDATWLEPILERYRERTGGLFLDPHVHGTVERMWKSRPWAASDEQVIPYLYPLPPYITTLRGYVILNLREKEFSQRINSSNYGSEGSITTVSAEGVVISSVDKTKVGTRLAGTDLFRDLKAGLAATGEVSLTVHEGEVEHLITAYRSEEDGRIYVGDFSLAGLTGSVWKVRLLTLAISLGVVLVGLALSYFVSARFFNPVRRMVQEIQERTGTMAAEGGQNELGLLAGAVETLLRRENQLFSALEGQRRRQRDEWVRRAVGGNLAAGGEDRPEGLAGSRLYAACLIVDGADDFAARVVPEQREYLLSLLGHMAEEAFRPRLACIASPGDSSGLVLVLGSDIGEPAELADAIEDGFEALGAESRSLLGTTVSLCVGAGRTDPCELGGSWAEAQLMLRQRFIQGWDQWYWWENRLELSSPGFYPRREERRILTALEAGDRGDLEPALRALIDAIRQRPGLGHDNILLILNQLTAGVIKHLIDQNRSVHSLFGPGFDIYGSLSRQETLDAAESWIRDLLRTVVGEGACCAPAEQDHCAAMVDFIRANLHRDFGVEEVAQAAGLSYSHARKIFQERMGDSVVNYTNTLRISEAKRLLRETAEPLAALAPRLGYNNTQSFTRYFKKYVGQTPGDYRDGA